MAPNNNNKNMNKRFPFKYLECMHNYAASSIGHVLDGCCEFYPNGPSGTPQSFICAACQCHRNYHKRVKVRTDVQIETVLALPCFGAPLVILDGQPGSSQVLKQYSVKPTRPRQAFNNNNNVIILPPPGVEMETMEVSDQSGGSKRKSCSFSSSSRRMKLNPDQRKKVEAFVEEMGWKWTKYNEKVTPFCDEIGITPKFLKNWIDNNKRKNKETKKNISEENINESA